MRVAALGRAVLDGLARAGMPGTIKHMPGHGRTTTDTHLEMPTVTASEAELEIDLAPFRALNTAPIGMTGHLLFTAWDSENPATQSPFVIEADDPGQDRLRRAAADRRSRHGGAFGHRARTRRALACGGLRYCAQLLGEDGRHDRHCRSAAGDVRQDAQRLARALDSVRANPLPAARTPGQARCAAGADGGAGTDLRQAQGERTLSVPNSAQAEPVEAPAHEDELP